MTTTVQALAAEIRGALVVGDASTAIRGCEYDSRRVRPGDLFICIPGAHSDGHDFAGAAVASGAAALVVQRMLDVPDPQIVVESARAAAGPIAASVFGRPSESMTLVGVTGTNGKTTTTFLLESVFRALGMTPGVIGTVETHVGDEVLPVTRTTPEAVDLQRLLARMRDAGVTGVAMEASSEGLLFGRVEGTRFACAVFTNLSQDHLNTHGTMEAYFEAKSLLFRPEMSARAVVNVGDAYGRRLADSLSIPMTTFAADDSQADIRARSVSMDAGGSTVEIATPDGDVSVRVPLPGPFNVANALGVVAVGCALGWRPDAAAAGIAAVRGVPGRLERVDAGQDFTVLVDYAHTPDALEGVLHAARAITPSGGRLVVVFGCGGDRDRAKRPLMGKVAATIADRAIITSDNPRSEDPLAIISEIENGARDAGSEFESIPDRREAIAAAIRAARAGDVVVIAGKGHESGQEFADRTIPFDDRVVAREMLESA